MTFVMCHVSCVLCHVCCVMCVVSCVLCVVSTLLLSFAHRRILLRHCSHFTPHEAVNMFKALTLSGRPEGAIEVRRGGAESLSYHLFCFWCSLRK